MGFPISLWTVNAIEHRPLVNRVFIMLPEAVIVPWHPVRFRRSDRSIHLISCHSLNHSRQTDSPIVIASHTPPSIRQLDPDLPLQRKDGSSQTSKHQGSRQVDGVGGAGKVGGSRGRGGGRSRGSGSRAGRAAGSAGGGRSGHDGAGVGHGGAVVVRRGG
jgi:hypothetical protein